MVEKFRNPRRIHCHQQELLLHSARAHQRYMALTPLPCIIPSSASVERGVYCIGCEIRAREHGSCRVSGLTAYNSRYRIQNCITDVANISCQQFNSPRQCPLIAAKDRLHDSRRVLSHLEGCKAAQALLEVRWVLSQESISKTDLMKYSPHPCLRGLVNSLLQRRHALEPGLY